MRREAKKALAVAKLFALLLACCAGAHIKAEIARWAPVVKASGARPE